MQGRTGRTCVPAVPHRQAPPPPQALPLSALFRRGQAALAALQALPPAAPGAAPQLQHGLACVAHASRMVDSLALFSPNEVGEDIPTKDLRYLLLPALRADLLTHLHVGERLPRAGCAGLRLRLRWG